jgi:hypothetical protein
MPVDLRRPTRARSRDLGSLSLRAIQSHRHIRLYRPLALSASCPYATPPLTVFDSTGIFATRRERIEAAVEAAGQRDAQSYEGWIAADPFRGGVRVLITGPPGRSAASAPRNGRESLRRRTGGGRRWGRPKRCEDQPCQRKRCWRRPNRV